MRSKRSSGYGRIHFIYRAIGPSWLSTFGYANSRDGVHIDERSEEPVFVDTSSVRRYAQASASTPQEAAPSYQSGISTAGSEDPRLTRIEDTIYMTYTVYDGSHPPGVALTAIAVDDFLKQRWCWREPTLISAPHECHKNWVLFPEKIAGRYAVLHGISPAVLIDYHDTLEFADEEYIRSHYACSGHEHCWDNRIRGVGPPPIKTEAGWLVLYHAMDN